MPADLTRRARPGALMLAAPPPLALYVHVPWCLRKCPYCDFNSHALPAQTGAPTQQQERGYVDALIADLEASLPLIWGRPLQSVFIGGGTPSLFTPESIDRLLAAIRARAPLRPACEITLEANPGTFEKDRFIAFRQAGVTRLSIGVQSFNDNLLQSIGRVHNASQAHAAVREAARAFDTFNLDLMYALPAQDMAQLQADLRMALDYAPPHLSYYHLTIESGTRFARHPPPLPDADTAWDMLDALTAQTAAAGMARYEVSAFARAGHACQHNLNYWRFGDYLGIGAGAHGKLSFAHRIIRQVRYRHPQLYMQRASAGHAVAQEREIARRDLPFEFMLNALRLREGFEQSDFTERTGLPLSSIASALEKAEQNQWLTRAGQRIAPTARGFDILSDLQSLFLPEDA